MASPHVSGVVALMLQANKDLTVDQIEKILNETASPLKDDYYIDSPNHGYGYGKVDAYNAVELSKGQIKGKEVNKDKMGSFSGRLLARGEDKEKPSLDHKAISAVYTIYKTSFDANVKDNTGISYVKLFLDCGQGFEEYEMKLKRGTRIDGYYNIDIPVSKFVGVSSGKYYIECSDINGSVTKTEKYSFDVKNGVNIGYVQDFETDISGFEFGGESSLWKWGNIKSDEPDNKLIGTGPYSDNLKKDTITVMPPIDLSNTDKDAVLSFRHWYDLGNSENAFFDQAEVWIAEVDANSSADNLKWEQKRTYKNSSKDKWVDEFIDLSEYKGKKICLMFGLRANGAWKTKGQGWYIDDIKIEEAVKEIPEKPSKYLSLKSQKNGRYNFSFSPVANDKITAYELYRSKNPEGPFERIKTVEKGDTNGGFGRWTITLSDIPIPQKGSYYYYAVSKIGKNSSEPSEIQSITFTEGEEFLSYDFENGKQGWTSLSDSGELAWDFGKLDYGDKYNANFKKPTESQSLGKNPGMNMWATNMDDHRAPKSKYSLISPTMNLSGLSDAKIYYQNWFGSSGKRGFDDYGSYNQDLGEIYISKDDGSSWEKIYTLDEKMLDKKGNRHTWFTDGVEIPKGYLTDKIKIKFLLDTGDDKGAYDPEQCGGWYIDDISINTNLNKNTGNSLQREHVFANKSPFKLQNMTMASGNTSSNNGLIPLVGKITIKETGVSVTSEAGTGKFSIKHPVGSYTAIAEAEGYISREVPVTITSNSELKDIYLDKAQETTLTIKVLDEDSKPVNANVKIYKQDGLEVLKEGNGSNISLDKILPGKYNITVSAGGYKTYREEITISESKEIEIKLDKISLQEGKNVGYTKEKASQLAGQDEKNVTFANKISNSKDAQVEEVTYYITKTKAADLQGSSYRISIYDKNDKDGLPGKILYSKDLNFKKEGWNSLKISNVQVDGEFYIAFTKLSGELALGIDNETSDIDSVKMFNNAWIEPQTQGSYMIGARLSEIEDTQKEALEAATKLVEKAENEKTEDAYKAAVEKVEALKDSESKTGLQERLVAVDKYIQADNAIKALEAKNISDVTKEELANAETLVNAVKDEWKTDLTARLTSLKDIKADDDKRKAEEAKKLVDAKEEATKKINELENLNQAEKTNHISKVNGLNKVEDVQKALLDAQKDNAKNIIASLNKLKEDEVTKANKDIDQAADVDAIKNIVNTAQATQNERQSLDECKNQAKTKIDALSKLSDTEKNAYKNSISLAATKEAADAIVLDAQKENAKKKLEDLTELNEEEKAEALKAIDQATNESDLDKAIKTAEASNVSLDELKAQAKDAIDKLPNLSEEDKKDAKDKVDNAKTKGDVNQVVEAAKAKDKTGQVVPKPAPRPQTPSIRFFVLAPEKQGLKPVEVNKTNQMTLEANIKIGSKKLTQMINGQSKEVEMDVAAYADKNRTYIPLRFVGEAMGFDVRWDNEARMAVLTNKDKEVKVFVDSNIFYINGEKFESDVKPQIKNDRTMIPVGNFARCLGLKDGKDIFWDQGSQQVTIKQVVNY